MNTASDPAHARFRLQTHLCRLEGQDRCILQIRVEIDGIPYGDTFAVEIRWVATREGENDMLVDVGVEVDFKKSTFLKSKIRAGTIEETTSVHKDLFTAIQTACAAVSGVEPLPQSNAEISGKSEAEIPATRTHFLDYRGWKASVAHHRKFVTGCGVLLLLVVFYRFLTRGSDTTSSLDETCDASTISASEIHTMSVKIDNLETELAHIREVLSEILTHVRDNRDGN
jgi:VAD1 Analog of StAR-related lipid transfer domain